MIYWIVDIFNYRICRLEIPLQTIIVFHKTGFMSSKCHIGMKVLHHNIKAWKKAASDDERIAGMKQNKFKGVFKTLSWLWVHSLWAFVSIHYLNNNRNMKSFKAWKWFCIEFMPGFDEILFTNLARILLITLQSVKSEFLLIFEIFKIRKAPKLFLVKDLDFTR